MPGEGSPEGADDYNHTDLSACTRSLPSEPSTSKVSNPGPSADPPRAVFNTSATIVSGSPTSEPVLTTSATNPAKLIEPVLTTSATLTSSVKLITSATLVGATQEDFWAVADAVTERPQPSLRSTEGSDRDRSAAGRVDIAAWVAPREVYLGVPLPRKPRPSLLPDLSRANLDAPTALLSARESARKWLQGQVAKAEGAEVSDV